MAIANWQTQAYGCLQSLLFNNPHRVIRYLVRDEKGGWEDRSQRPAPVRRLFETEASPERTCLRTIQYGKSSADSSAERPKNSRSEPGKLKRERKPMIHRPQTKNGSILYSDPEWETTKCSRRNIDHNDAVQESFFLQRQFRTLWSSQMAASPVELVQVLRTLSQKKIPFVLTGAHAIGGWTGRPRATYDVDILVK